MNNPLVINLNNRIEKTRKNIKYYEEKAKAETYSRGKLIYKNTPEWSAYWLEVADHLEGVVDDYYELLKLLHKTDLGCTTYPQCPSETTLMGGWTDVSS